MMARAYILWLVALVPSTAGAASAGLDELMNALAQRRHGEVSFVEQHFMALLSRPVESYGELIYDAPDRLEKRTLEPKRETMLLANGSLTIRRGRREHVLDVKAYPQVLLIVESIRATLAGDLGALARIFQIEFDGDYSRWALTLAPRQEETAKAVSHVRIEGIGDRLLKVEIRMADGDRSLLTLRDHRAP